jgi:hypothetical protein
MTAERMPDPAGSGSPTGLSVPAVLAVCDGLLGEVGRRDHRFSWLQAPDAGAERWLPVSAYYPGKRLVVLCDPDSSPHRQLYDELIPAHGLRLLPVTVGELPDDREHARALLEVRVAALAPERAPAGEMTASEPVERPRPISVAVSSLVHPSPAREPAPDPAPSTQAAAVQRAARLLAARRAAAGDTWSAASHVPARSGSRRSHPGLASRGRSASQAGVLQPPSLLLGLVLAGVVCLEMYIAVARIALSSGQLLLALGVALDACARALGGVAASKVNQVDWAWGSVIVGSPVVAGFALFQRSGPVTTEPAPLAGLVSLAAMALVAIALFASITGI